MNLQIVVKLVNSHREIISGLHGTKFICISMDKNLLRYHQFLIIYRVVKYFEDHKKHRYLKRVPRAWH